MQPQWQGDKRLECGQGVRQCQSTCSDVAQECVGSFVNTRELQCAPRPFPDRRPQPTLLPAPAARRQPERATLASRTAVLAAVTIGADQIFRLRRIGWKSNTIGDLGKSSRELASLPVSRCPFLEGCRELGVEGAIVLPSDLTQGGKNRLVDISDVNRRHVRHVITSISSPKFCRRCVADLHQFSSCASSTNRQSAFASRICGIERQLTSSSFGLATR